MILKTKHGEVTEWPKVRHWKCRVCQKRTAGSNPALSAMQKAAVGGFFTLRERRG